MKRLAMNGLTLEQKLTQLNDVIDHKKYFLDATRIMCALLFKEGKDKLALEVLKLAFTHDFSKTSELEFYGMAREKFDGTPKVNDDIKQNAIIHHQLSNKHHPEYWKNLNDMDELSIIELVLDWYARNLQFNSDPVDFLEESEDRFNFPEDLYNKIEKYFEILKREK